ncbi:MAG: hypothetical protein GEV11_16230 [Streptosporangiales bacterium]|nr:hypothetical protein [Streptosporangiales bacterium]
MPGPLHHRRPADPVHQLEPLVEGGRGLPAVEVGRDDLMPGVPQSLGGEEFGSAQAKDGVEERDMSHDAIVPSEVPGRQVTPDVAVTGTFERRV